MCDMDKSCKLQLQIVWGSADVFKHHYTCRWMWTQTGVETCLSFRFVFYFLLYFMSL